LHYFTQTICQLCPFFFMLALGCTPLQVKDGHFSPSHKKYSVTLPGKGWEAIKVGKEDIALWNGQSRATIACISSEIQGRNSSLEALHRQLFIGMKDKNILLDEPLLVDNQQAMHTILLCTVDNYPIKIESYIIKCENKIYDFLYWTPPDFFDYAQNDFKNSVKSFRFKPTEEQSR